MGQAKKLRTAQWKQEQMELSAHEICKHKMAEHLMKKQEDKNGTEPEQSPEGK